MKKIIYFLVVVLITGSFTQCKKGKQPKLENPFGLLLLGSDTSLPDGRYVIRTMNGCTTPASTLRCDYTADGVIGYNGSLPAIDHITINDIDSSDVWYVKKVRYVSPDPDYALAFGYRIYQRMPDGGYRFLSLTATASTLQWTNDEIGFTYTDDRAKSVKAGAHYLDKYPADPPVPTSLATNNDTLPEIKTRFLFQLYASEEKQGAFFIKTGGLSATTGSDPVARWNFCLACVDDNACDASNLYPHFRDEDPRCQTWRENSVNTRRCYIREYYFQKVY